MSRFQQSVTKTLVIALAATLVTAAWYSPLQQVANEQVDAGLKTALISFASARALNAVISVLQGTQLGLQPAGVGVTLSLGQVLDPINQMVEQFSSLMLVASVSFGIQKALLAIGAHWVISLVVSAVAMAWAALHIMNRAPPSWLSKLFVILLMVRFAVPTVTMGTDLVYDEFLRRDFAVHQLALAAASSEVQKASSQPGESTSSWWDRMKEKGNSFNPASHLNFEGVKKAVTDLPERLIRMTVVFVLQTIIIPIFLLWAMYRVLFGVIPMRPSWPSATR